MTTDNQLRQIQANAEKRSMEETGNKPEKSATPVCRKCGSTMTAPGGAFLLAAFKICPACIEAEATLRREQATEQDRQMQAKEAQANAEELVAFRADPLKGLAEIGVPPVLIGAELGVIEAAGDIPCDIIAAAQDWIVRPAGFLTMTGPPGSGKSFFAVALLRAVIEAGIARVKHCHFLTEYEYFNSIKLDYGVPSRLTFYDRLPLIVYDDLGAGYANDLRRSAIGELFRERWNRELPTICTTNLTIAQISSIDGRIASVLAVGQNVLVFPTNDLRRRGKLGGGHV